MAEPFDLTAASADEAAGPVHIFAVGWYRVHTAYDGVERNADGHLVMGYLRVEVGEMVYLPLVQSYAGTATDRYKTYVYAYKWTTGSNPAETGSNPAETGSNPGEPYASGWVPSDILGARMFTMAALDGDPDEKDGEDAVHDLEAAFDAFTVAD